MVNKKDKIVLDTFGAHLKAIRERKGMSLRELSYNCNIDNSKISKIESGQINITVLTVLELANGLEIPAWELLNFQKNDR